VKKLVIAAAFVLMLASIVGCGDDSNGGGDEAAAQQAAEDWLSAVGEGDKAACEELSANPTICTGAALPSARFADVEVDLNNEIVDDDLSPDAVAQIRLEDDTSLRLDLAKLTEGSWVVFGISK